MTLLVVDEIDVLITKGQAVSGLRLRFGWAVNHGIGIGR